jgi:hypothetical protein
MDAHRFDALTRLLGAGGSRRQAMAALVTSAAAIVFPRAGGNEADAACKGYRSRCKKKSSCCSGVGLRCRRKRCHCKKGWKRCQADVAGCTPVQTDPNHCGACGHQCPPETPCCINGSCQELCDGSCCADCFIDLLNGVTPQPDTETCCGPGSGTLCSANENDASDDSCCYPDQSCVNGVCCRDGHAGAVICGGVCCASASCCNGQCCPEGQVCGTTTEGLACVTANRACTGPADCLAGEVCHGGVCCAGDRICGDGVGGDVCCPTGEYCDDSLGGNNIGCCAINTTCKSTWRGRRVRR